MTRKKRSHDVEHLQEDSEGTWAVSYGDMVTLLLTFFIVFFSLDPNHEKIEKRKTLNISLINELQRSPSSEKKSETTVRTDNSQKAPKNNRGIAAVNLEGKVHEYGDSLLVEFPEVSFFRSGDIQLTNEGKNSLRIFMKKYLPYAGQYKVSIQAFTDHRKVRQEPGRKFSDNLELSALRAIAAMRTLQREGIPLSQMEVAGYGEIKNTALHLMKKNKDAKELELSRKVVLVIKPEDT